MEISRIQCIGDGSFDVQEKMEYTGTLLSGNVGTSSSTTFNFFLGDAELFYDEVKSHFIYETSHGLF